MQYSFKKKYEEKIPQDWITLKFGFFLSTDFITSRGRKKIKHKGKKNFFVKNFHNFGWNPDHTPKNVPDEDAETDHSILSALTLSGAEFVDQGEAIRLSCNATGVRHAPEDVDWFFQGLKIQSSVQDEIIITKFHSPETKTLISTLEIERSKMKHSGMYICRSTDLTIKSHNVQVINGKYFQRLF